MKKNTTTTTKQTAAQTYTARKNEIEKMIAELQSKLAKHAAEFEKSGSTNWGYVGDLGYAAEQIKNINDQIN